MSTGASIASRSTLLRDPLLVGGIGVAGLALLRWRDPHSSGSYGFCPFLLLTGQPCPGCGGLRAVNDLTHGDVIGALGSNAVAVVLLGALAVAWTLWLVRRWRGRDVRMIVLSSAAMYAVLAAFLGFGVLRMTPWGAGLGP